MTILGFFILLAPPTLRNVLVAVVVILTVLAGVRLVGGFGAKSQDREIIA